MMLHMGRCVAVIWVITCLSLYPLRFLLSLFFSIKMVVFETLSNAVKLVGMLCALRDFCWLSAMMSSINSRGVMKSWLLELSNNAAVKM